MAILYRPVKSKAGALYTIEPYDSKKVEPSLFNEIGMDVHFGAMFFFLHTLTELVNDILSSLKQAEIPPSLRETLVKSGEHIKQLYNYQEMISPASLLSLTSR